MAQPATAEGEGDSAADGPAVQLAADGQIASHEAYLVRKISNLLDLEPGYLNAAKKKATGERS